MAKFTDEQNEVIECLNRCLNGKMRKRFLLDAAGGSGKSFLLQKFANNIETLFLAPTHQAVKVLRKLGIHNSMTISKYLGMTVDFDSDGNKIMRLRYPKDNDGINLLIVDECSMLKTSEINILIELNKNILFCGDRAQLPPIEKDENGVDLSISNVYKLNFDRVFSLTKIFRTDNLNLLEINRKYRNNVLGLHGTYKIDLKQNFTTDTTFFEKCIAEKFLENDDTVVLAYTNKMVKEYNEIIRTALFGDRAAECYVDGETLIVDEFFSRGDKKYYTGEKVKIVKVDIVQEEFILEFCPCPKCSKYDTKEKKINIKFYKLTDENDVQHLKPYDELNKKLYQKLYLRRRCIIINDETKNKTKLWKEFYEDDNSYNAPLIYKYALTIHKSQGSGWHNVFVDMRSIFTSVKMYKNLKYVGVSRAKNYLCCLAN